MKEMFATRIDSRYKQKVIDLQSKLKEKLGVSVSQGETVEKALDQLEKTL